MGLCALRALPCKPTLRFHVGLVKHFFCKVFGGSAHYAHCLVNLPYAFTRGGGCTLQVLCLSFLTVLCARLFGPISLRPLCEHMHKCAVSHTPALTRAFCSRHWRSNSQALLIRERIARLLKKTFSQVYLVCKSFLWIFQTFLQTLGISEKSLTPIPRLSAHVCHALLQQADNCRFLVR